MPNSEPDPSRLGPVSKVGVSVLSKGRLPGDALRAMAQARGKVKWHVSVDSTSCRGHVHAAGARRDSIALVDGEPADHGFGRSRGGWSTKTHLAVDQDRGVLAFHITAGQAGDSDKLAVRYTATIHVAVIDTWLNRLS